MMFVRSRLVQDLVLLVALNLPNAAYQENIRSVRFSKGKLKTYEDRDQATVTSRVVAEIRKQAELEQKVCNERYHLSRVFDSAGNIEYRGKIPSRSNFTVCLWQTDLQSSAISEGAIFQYNAAKEKDCMTIIVKYLTRSKSLQLSARTVTKFWNYTALLTGRNITCIVSSQDENAVNYCATYRVSNRTVTIPDDGALIPVQPAVTNAGGNSSRIDKFLVWSRPLSANEMASVFQLPCSCKGKDTKEYAATRVLPTYELICDG